MDKLAYMENGDVRGVNNLFKAVGINLSDINPNRPWTPDGEQYLIELYEKGYTAAEMAAEMKRTTGNVIGKIYDLGEAGRLSMELWGSKTGKKYECKYQLFIIPEDDKP